MKLQTVKLRQQEPIKSDETKNKEIKGLLKKLDKINPEEITDQDQAKVKKQAQQNLTNILNGKDQWGLSKVTGETKNSIRLFALRWTQHEKNNQDLFNNPKELIPIINKTLREKNNGNEIKQIVYQLEKGEQTGKIHYQGFLYIEKKLEKVHL